MSDPLVNRWAGALGVLASVVIVLSESVRLGIGSSSILIRRRCHTP